MPMKFGKRILAIQAEHAAAWAPHYLDYKMLKVLLKRIKELKERSERQAGDATGCAGQECWAAEKDEVEVDIADAEEGFLLALEVS